MWTVMLASGFVWSTPATSLSIEPTSIIIDEQDAVSVRVSAQHTSPEDLSVFPEVGTISAQAKAGDELRYQWKIPKSVVPRRVAIGVANRRTGEVAFGLLSVSRRAKFKVWTDKGAEVNLTVQGRIAGSGRADDLGRLTLSVVVPPGADVAEITEKLRTPTPGSSRSTEIGLRDELRLFGVAAQTNLVPDGKAASTVFWLPYQDSSGECLDCSVRGIPGPNAAVTDQVSAGSHQSVVRVGPFPPDLGALPSSFWVEGRVERAGQVANRRIEMSVDQLGPARIAIRPLPIPVRAGQTVDLDIEVFDITGRAIQNAWLSPAPADDQVYYHNVAPLKSGGYRATITIPTALPERGEVTVAIRAGLLGPEDSLRIPVQPGPVARLTAVSAARAEGSEISVRGFDAFDNPTRLPLLDWTATSGSLGSAKPSADGGVTAFWQPHDPSRQEQALVRVSLPATRSLEASIPVSHARPQQPVRIDLAIGGVHAFGPLSGGGAHLRCAWDPGWSSQLKLIADLDAWYLYRSRRIPVDGSVLLYRQIRQSAAVPAVLLGVETDLHAFERTWLRLAAFIGGAAPRLATSAAGWGADSAWGLVPAAGLSVTWALPVGPGAALVELRGQDLLMLPAGFVSRPRALSAHLGYSWFLR